MSARSKVRSKRRSSPDPPPERDSASSTPHERRSSSETHESVCYCNGPRQLGTLEFHCFSCKRWFHNACLKDLTEMCGLPFMVCYNFHCRNCSSSKKETWELKPTHFPHMALMALANMTFDYHKGNRPQSSDAAIKYFHLEKEIIPYFDTNWENLTTLQRRVKNTWHTTLQRTFSKEESLFVAASEDESAFALKEADLLKIGPLHEAVRQIGKRAAPTNTPTTPEPSTPSADKAEDFTGPKTRGASRRKVLESSSFAAPATIKRSRASTDASSGVGQGASGESLQYPFNRDGYRYYLVEKDEGIQNRAAFDTDDLSTAVRTIPSFIYRVVHPSIVTISPNDRAHQLKVADDQLTVTGVEGYAVARATHSVSHGKWYFEVTFLTQPDDSHVRIGWGQAHAVLQACLGYSKFSYAWRSLKGTAFHDARGVHYADGGYKQGDTLGCLIDLPELPTITAINEAAGDGEPIGFSDFLPPSYKEHSLVNYKHRMFFEEKEEELAAAVKKLKTLRGSKIEFFRNGVSCGVAFHDIYAGHYYPAVSIFKSATLRMNFGPRFKYPPRPPARGMWERPEDIQVQQCTADLLYQVCNQEEIDQKKKEYFENATS